MDDLDELDVLLVLELLCEDRLEELSALSASSRSSIWMTRRFRGFSGRPKPIVKSVCAPKMICVGFDATFTRAE